VTVHCGALCAVVSNGVLYAVVSNGALYAVVSDSALYAVASNGVLCAVASDGVLYTVVSDGALCAIGMEFRAVFVSTVRSRHHVSQMADIVGEFGFLSEPQLVNTALTRAKSWLAVVGDPVALCSVGQCGAVWHTYLKHCEKIGGIHPADLSLDDVWQHSQSLANLLTVNVGRVVGPVNGGDVSRVGLVNGGDVDIIAQDLARISPHFISEETSMALSSSMSSWLLEPVCVSESQSQPSSTLPPATTSHLSSLNLAEPQNHATQAVYAARGRRVSSADHSSDSNDDDTCDAYYDVTHSVTADSSAVMSIAEWSLDYQLEPDEIIQQLAKVLLLITS